MMEYERPEFEIILIQQADVVTLTKSGDYSGDDDGLDWGTIG